jgi:hypothetical protein
MTLHGLFDAPRCPDCDAAGYARGHAGCFRAPLGNETLARTSGPSTSRESAESLRGSAALAEAQRLALALVRQYPGSTAAELSRLAGHADPRRVNRRLSELARAGLAFTCGTKPDPDTGRACHRWFAHKEG